ncbi:MAG TPA: AI-2E family transporter [Ktedonobacteraceae bacterium]
MSPNTTDIAREKAATDALSSRRGRRRKLITALTVLAFLAIIAIALYALSLIIGAVILLLFSALLAYLNFPLVQFLQRRLPQPLAIAVAYLLVAGALAVGMFIITSSLIRQSSSLAQSIQYLLSPAGARRLQSLIDFLGKFGITKDQVAQFKNQLLSQVQGALSGLLPFLTGVFTNIINLVIVVTLSVYFVVDGPRIIGWLRLKTPATQRGTINFLLSTLDQSLGGYFRGSLLIALIGAVSTGVGLALLHVPYAALLGVLFFLLYFVPVIGGIVLGALCILAALPQGWVVTLVVAVYITLLQGVVIGQIISPRIFSKTVGVHPIVAIFALFAGAELFGLIGGLLSVPVAGVLQQIIVALWHRWKDEHPEQFPPEELPLQPSAPLPGQQVAPTETPVPGRRP